LSPARGAISKRRGHVQLEHALFLLKACSDMTKVRTSSPIDRVKVADRAKSAEKWPLACLESVERLVEIDLSRGYLKVVD
jgi:hypothetical protein